MFKLSKKTLDMCQIYSKLTIKTPERLFFNFEYFTLYTTVITAEFKQINAVWVREYIVSENIFTFSICEKYIVP